MGTRMRPHTLTVPKPLISVYGKPIVQSLVEDLASVTTETIEEIAFIIHPSFSEEAKQSLLDMAQKMGAKGVIYYQEQAQGTAHAINCAAPSLKGNVIVAFADTLFISNFTLNTESDAIIWVQRVENPSAFGVVKTNEQGVITDFVEKPQEFVSDLAIIGIYYFKDGENLQCELQYLIDNNIHVKGEYQLTTALENMKNKNLQFHVGKVDTWLDCGNKNATVDTNTKLLQHYGSKIANDIECVNSHIIEPCCIAAGVKIENSIVGPNVSIGEGTKISYSVISNTIIQNNSCVSNVRMHNSMVGSSATIARNAADLSVSDYSEVRD